MPEGFSSTKILLIAVKEGVEFAPGSRFFANPVDRERFIRLNFATLTIEEIEEGIIRLKTALRKLEENQ